MNKSKLKKYVGKNVVVHFRYKLRTCSGIVEYRPNEPLCDYFLFQSQNSSGSCLYYSALEPKMIGHIEILER